MAEPDIDYCHLNLAKHYRGGERQTEILVRELASRGYSQRLVIKRGNSLKERCRDIPGLSVCEVASNPVAAGWAARGCRVVHAHDGRTVYSGLVANLLFGSPYVITRRVVAPQKDRVLRRWAYRRAGRIVAISSAVVRSIKKRFDGDEPAIIPDAHSGFRADGCVVEAIRDRFPGKTLIGHVGALVHSHKGQMTIIEVARQAAESRPDWQFVICGDGEDEARYREAIGDLENIELTGWVENVGDYLASFDVFLYPSLHEALGSTLLDAMYFGLPIVASKVDGIPDVVVDGVNGMLVPPEQPAAIIAAIDNLLQDSERLAAMQAGNREKARLFDVEHMTNAYLDVYEAL
ncbi:MAG TPA: glycosyltransferase family 4 protein [Woeseiaceae bacterium]|nr:glycosyltransferase family 4 protein [Woeseiaceae bacterium]